MSQRLHDLSLATTFVAMDRYTRQRNILPAAGSMPVDASAMTVVVCALTTLIQADRE